MQLFRIPDVRHFMQALLQKDVFDTFLVTEGTITTFVTYHIDGRFHPEFFDSSDETTDPAADSSAENGNASPSEYVFWRQLKETSFSLIKGVRTPLKMHFVFRLADYNVEKLLTQSGLPFTLEDIAGLYLNILFDGKAVSLTTGTSLRTFTLDKSLEHTWDEMVERLLQARGIEFDIE